MDEDQVRDFALKDAEYIISRIISLRKLKQLTQEQLAEKAGISRNSVGQIERGSVKISIVTFCALLKGLNISYVDFFDGLEERKEITYTASDQILELIKQIEKHPNRDEYIEVMQILLKVK